MGFLCSLDRYWGQGIYGSLIWEILLESCQLMTLKEIIVNTELDHKTLIDYQDGRRWN
jgi:hypothetical protein